MAGSRGEAISILRTLYRELRPTVQYPNPETHVYQTQLWQYIIGLCRTCRGQSGQPQPEQAQKNLEETGRSYIFYLQSLKEYNRISDVYKGAGERTAEATAKLLGFKMPHEPKDLPKEKGDVFKVSSEMPSEKVNETDSASPHSVAYRSPQR